MFCELLKMLREEKNVTGDTVANAIGVSGNAYRNYERGAREPSFETLIKLADFYNVSTDYLLGRTDIRRMASDDPVEELTDDAVQQWLVKSYMELSDDERAEFSQTLLTIVGKTIEEVQAECPPEEVPPPIIKKGDGVFQAGEVTHIFTVKDNTSEQSTG